MAGAEIASGVMAITIPSGLISQPNTPLAC
jgi:hypothetical protein